MSYDIGRAHSLPCRTQPNRYDVWFPQEQWPRVREFLHRLDWDDQEKADLVSGTHIPLWLPSLSGMGTVTMAWAEDEGPHVTDDGLRAPESVVGTSVGDSPVWGAGWHDWTFARYVWSHPGVRVADPGDVVCEPTWAAVCAHLQVPAYLEVGPVDSDEVDAVYVVSVAGDVHRLKDVASVSCPGRSSIRQAALRGAEQFDDDRFERVPATSVDDIEDEAQRRCSQVRDLADAVHQARDAASVERRPWEGDDIDSMLTRAERGIVAYDDLDLHAAAFRTATELQARLDEVFETSPIRLVAYDLDVDAYEAAHSRHGTLRMGAHPAWLPTPDEGVSTAQAMLAESHDVSPDHDVAPGDVARTWIPHLMAPWLGEGWWSAVRSAVDVRPSLTVVTDGPVVRRLHAHVCAGIETLRPYLRRFDRPSLPLHERWFVLHVEGMPTALMCPRSSTTLQIHIDDDGSSLYLQLVHDEARIDELRRLRDFRRRWADWLDDDHPLTPARLAAGVRDIEQRLAEDLDGELP